MSRAVDNARSIESQEESPLHHKGDAYASLEKGQCEAPDGTALVDAALNLQKEMYQVDSRVADGTQSYLGHVSERYALCNSNGLDLEDKVSYTVGFGFWETVLGQRAQHNLVFIMFPSQGQQIGRAHV